MNKYAWIVPGIILVAVAAVAYAVLTSRSADTVDAQTVIADACADAEEIVSSHTILNGVETTAGEVSLRFRWDVKTNGKNLYRHSQNLDTVEQSELYMVDGQFYNREMGLSGEWGEWSVQDLNFPEPEPTGPVGQVDDDDDGDGSAPAFCGLEIMQDHKYLGEVQLGGEKVKHFSARVDDSEVKADWQFWINTDGQVSKFSVDETFTGQLKVKTEATITYPDQPFTITAPTIP